MQALIALDQLVNTLLGGMADETLSARAHRMRSKGQRYWGWTASAIDALFFGRQSIAKSRGFQSWSAGSCQAVTTSMGGGEVRQETASADAVNRGGIAPGDAYAALQTKLEELDAYTHNVLHQFPRVERHLLCSDMRGAMNRMQRLLATAWKRRQKAAALFDMDVEIEVFRGQVRKACRLQYITPQRLDVWMRHTNEIGRMLGAWIKHETEK